jgi:membrane protein DedA with SNARE-associated domain
MSAIFQFVLRHGYSILFVALFARQIGFPMPGPLFLLAAGALAATGKMGVPPVIGLAISACVLADWVWYEAGRRGGDKVLHFMHQFTRDPDSHIRRAKNIFARHGLPLLLVAKFILGLDAVAPPLAGASRTSRVRFLFFDAVGAGLYTFVYGGLGYLFSNDLDRAAAYVSRAGTLLACLAFGGVCVFIAHKLVQRQRIVSESRTVRVVPADAIEYGDSVDMSCGIIAGDENGEQRVSEKTGIAESCEARSARCLGTDEEVIVPPEMPAQQKGNAMILAKRLTFLPTLFLMMACAYG